jgi:hypothetical protein
MITDEKLDTIRPGGRHLGLMSTAAAAPAVACDAERTT